MPRAWVLLVLVGCGDTLTQNEFIAEYEELHCESYALCASEEMLRTVNERECLEHLRYEPYPTNQPDCRYEEEAAVACLEAMRTAGCVGVNPEVPIVCADVWSLCPYPRIVPVADDTPVPPA